MAEGSAHSGTCSRSLTSTHTFSTRTDAAKGVWSGSCWKPRDKQAAWSGAARGLLKEGAFQLQVGRGRWAGPGKAPRREEAWRREEGLLAPRTHPAVGWLQVNWSQPPMPLNSHGAPQPWCPSRGGAGWLEGDVLSSSHWPQTLQREMAAQSRAPARVGPVRGVEIIRGGRLGHCPVAMAPG